MLANAGVDWSGIGCPLGRLIVGIAALIIGVLEMLSSRR
jgi:hypothetical protein